MDAVKRFVNCDKCGETLYEGKPFPCRETNKTNDEIIANCGCIMKQWQTAETEEVMMRRVSKDAWAEKVQDLPTKGSPETPKLSGGSAGYYKLPEAATELQDLIEHKSMDFGRANIFKAMYRLGEKDVATEEYDLEKTIWFGFRKLNHLRKAQGLPARPMPEWLHP